MLIQAVVAVVVVVVVVVVRAECKGLGNIVHIFLTLIAKYKTEILCKFLLYKI
jgi:hypothetical protein